MNFEQLQSTWSAQPAVQLSSVEVGKLQRSLAPEISRRRRFLGYAIFILVLGLVALPLVTFDSYRHAHPKYPVWYWTYFAGWMFVQTGFLVAAIRAVERHGAIRQQSTRSLRDLALASLASVEAEMRDCRLALWIIPPLVMFQLVDLYLKFNPANMGWAPLLGRAAFILGLPLVMGLGFWRHYRVNLARARVQQLDLVKQLS